MANILVVDDAIFMRKIIADIFIKEGFNIIGEAENAKEAVELYKKLKPDLVTLDIVMPEIDHISALKAVEMIMDFDPNANIMMVSAMGQQEYVVNAIKAGAKDFIVKPFHPLRIIEAVRRILKET
ncbi:MAG: response regulator [Candidatus Margulisiibacteriota bacterium]|jgi:two-component system chemotaxis response regulator CheY